MSDRHTASFTLATLPLPDAAMVPPQSWHGRCLSRSAVRTQPANGVIDVEGQEIGHASNSAYEIGDEPLAKDVSSTVQDVGDGHGDNARVNNQEDHLAAGTATPAAPDSGTAVGAAEASGRKRDKVKSFLQHYGLLIMEGFRVGWEIFEDILNNN